MASVRVTTGGLSGGRGISRESGDIVGMSLNVSGLKAAREKLTGKILLPIVMKAMKIALAQAKENWPIDTGASNASIRIQPAEWGETMAKVGLLVGGQRLIKDPRNKSKKDYAPFIEFNGSPAGRGQFTITDAMLMNRDEMVESIRADVAGLLG